MVLGNPLDQVGKLLLESQIAIFGLILQQVPHPQLFADQEPFGQFAAQAIKHRMLIEQGHKVSVGGDQDRGRFEGLDAVDDRQIKRRRRQRPGKGVFGYKRLV